MARSDNWRINKSSIMAVEGAQLLRALQKVAGAAGIPKGFTVKFATKEHGSGVDLDGKEIIIGAGRLFKEAPLPAEEMDILVGLVLHEVGHQQIGTDEAWRAVRAYLHTSGVSVSGLEIGMLQKFVNIGEDITIESRILANQNLADYGRTTTDWAVARMRDVDPNKLLELWIEYALGHKTNSILNLKPEMVEPMRQLVSFTGWLRHEHDYMERAKAYRDYWTALKNIILNPPKEMEPEKTAEPEKTGAGSSIQGTGGSSTEKTEMQESPTSSGDAGQNAEESKSGEDGGGDGNNSPTSTQGNSDSPEPRGDMDVPLAPVPEDVIDEKLEKEIEAAVQVEAEDITEQVAEELGGTLGVDRPETLPVIRSRETKTPLIKPNTELCKRLERVMTIRKRLQARTMRGELEGRIDQRHLDRVRTDKRVFSQRYKFPDGFPNTRILIDLSGSMSGKEANEVLEAAGALQTLVNAEVWCYNFDDGKVNLVRMDEGRMVHRFMPDGTTPSGLAIIGVALGMKKGGLVVHLTDGGHNVGYKPWTAHWILKGRGIELVNLIWGSKTDRYDLEGMNCRKLNGLAEFPDALYQILVERVKLGRLK